MTAAQATPAPLGWLRLPPGFAAKRGLPELIEEWRYTAFVANTEPKLFANELTKHEPWVLYDCLDLWNRIVAAANKSPEEFVDAEHGDAFREYVQVTRDMIIQELVSRGLPVLGLESRRFNEEPRN